MAEVFRAREPRAIGEARTIVLKRMLPHVAAEASGVAMFEEEARLAAHVRHPNVVELLGIVEADGQPHLALEYVPGCDLWRLSRWLIREGRTLGLDLVVFVLAELVAGLEAVHEARDERGEPLGIVHQDVSPSNVLLSVHGDVKLGDFGIAKAAALRAHPGVSLRAKGKLGYLAPEQVIGGVATHATDVFAAAVIAAELLLGRPLFGGASELAVLLAIRDANVQPLLELALPAELEALLVEALARDPSARPATARELAARLAPFVAGPPSVLRRELAGLVLQASGLELGEAEPTPLGEVPLSDAQRTPLTEEVPSKTYEVHTASGERRGPWTFAQLVEAIATGRVGVDDRVSTNGGAPEPLHRDPALVRHLPLSSLTAVTRDADLAREPDVRCAFAQGGFVRALAESALRRESGLWLCEQAGVRKEVYVHLGAPVFVGSNVAGELLGESLVARGVLSRGELDMALAVLPRFDGRLGDTLVALGLVEPVQLFRTIAEQVREKLLDLFTWQGGTAELYRGVPAPPSGFPLDLDVWEIIDAGLQRRLDAGLEEDRFQDHLLSSIGRVPGRADHGALPSPLAELLARLESPTPLPEVVEALGSTDDRRRGYRIVALALGLDLVRWAEPAEPLAR